jgi:predicted AlkP superfamily phosphohydrolase/phosphomutase
MFANLDWSKTVAYCRTPSSNGITIRKDTNGSGGVKPENYEAIRERLTRDLEELRDPSTGERIITGIFKREDVFPGPAMADAPDLLMVLRDCGFVSIKNKEPVVEKRKEVAGTHHPEGVFLAFGPGIAKGKKIDRLQIADVGATLLYSLGLSVPADVEGKVPEAVFTERHLAERPIRIGDFTSAGTNRFDQSDISENEKSQIMNQLRMLGYVE